MENNEQLEQQIRDLFSQNPKLRTITESFQGNKEFLGNILLTPEEIGRASCRERVYVLV